MNSTSISDDTCHQPRPGTESTNETDSNANACCLGNNFVTLQCTTKHVDVHACNESIKPLLNVPVVSGAAVWDDPISGQTCVLVVKEALHCGNKLDHSLINPNQIQSFGIDCWDNPFDETRGISSRPVEFDSVIPLATNGTEIQFKSWAPTPDELMQCPHVDLTLKTNWSPTKVCLSQNSTSPGESSDNLLDTCPRSILLANLRSVNLQVSRSECDATSEDIPLTQSHSSSN